MIVLCDRRGRGLPLLQRLGFFRRSARSTTTWPRYTASPIHYQDPREAGTWSSPDSYASFRSGAEVALMSRFAVVLDSVL